MEDLLKKVSQYQLFNFLLSGAVLVVTLSKTTDINLTNDDALTAFFTFYFLGLVISRVGSLVVGPLLKKMKVITFAPYADYLVAVKIDPKIDTLSQENNTYRTLIAAFIVFLAIYALNKNASSFILGKSTPITYVLAVGMVLLFTFAYRKQTTFITKRIKKTKAE